MTHLVQGPKPSFSSDYRKRNHIIKILCKTKPLKKPAEFSERV